MENDIKSALDKVMHPAIKCSLGELGIIRSWLVENLNLDYLKTD